VEKLQEYNIPFTHYSRIKNGEDFTDGEGNSVSNSELTEEAAPPRRYAYCSDTIFMPELAESVKGVDLLYHEATFLHDLKERATATFHSTAREAATIALEGEVGKLLIGHFSARYKQLEAFLEEATAVFPNSDLAVEGEVYRVD